MRAPPQLQPFTIWLVAALVSSGVLSGKPLAADDPADRSVDIPARWQQLAPISDRFGFAGPFAGAVNETLFIAGGANFPEKHPWEGGRKVWHDRVFALESPQGKWTAAGRLPHPLGYGVSFTTRDGLILVGGSDETKHFRSVWRMTRANGELKFEALPDLPAPCAMMCGVQLQNRLYIIGGVTSPTSTEALQSLWELDLSDLASGWKVLPPLPGPGRMLATAAASDDALFVFSGSALKPSPSDQPERIWLKDAYRFSPQDGWNRIADLPRVAVAAPSPAIRLTESRLLLLGGDDGTLVTSPPDKHPGFPRTSLIYDVSADRWSEGPELPFSLVTTPVVNWQGRDIIPGGELRPGIRSTEVWSRLRE